mgnify:CR=1 FL=1
MSASRVLSRAAAHGTAAHGTAPDPQVRVQVGNSQLPGYLFLGTADALIRRDVSLEQLTMASKLPGQDFYQASRIEARLQELEALALEEKKKEEEQAR